MRRSRRPCSIDTRLQRRIGLRLGGDRVVGGRIQAVALQDRVDLRGAFGALRFGCVGETLRDRIDLCARRCERRDLRIGECRCRGRLSGRSFSLRKRKRRRGHVERRHKRGRAEQ